MIRSLNIFFSMGYTHKKQMTPSLTIRRHGTPKINIDAPKIILGLFSNLIGFFTKCEQRWRNPIFWNILSCPSHNSANLGSLWSEIWGANMTIYFAKQTLSIENYYIPNYALLSSGKTKQKEDLVCLKISFWWIMEMTYYSSSLYMQFVKTKYSLKTEISPNSVQRNKK